jgi:hypothetical protein
MPTYKIIEMPPTFGSDVVQEMIIRFDDDGTQWGIPKDPSNSDYQAYLAYLAEQETA